MNLLQAWYYATRKNGPGKEITKENDVMRVFTKDNNLIITFDESNDLKDWISNVKFITMEEISLAAGKFIKEVSEYLRSYPNYDWWITGYSRGGAIARRITMYIAENHRSQLDTQERVVHCRAFEPPQIFPKGYAKYYNSNALIDELWTRNGRDPITYVPPNMYHTGKMVYLKQNWLYRNIPGFRSSTHLPNSVEKAIRKKLK